MVSCFAAHIFFIFSFFALFLSYSIYTYIILHDTLFYILYGCTHPYSRENWRKFAQANSSAQIETGRPCCQSS